MSFSPAAALLAASLLAPHHDEPARRLDTLEVVSMREPRTLEQALAAVEVIDRAAIEASQAADLVMLLAGRPGIDIARSGGSGQTVSLFMRGSNSNHVLVLVDGVRVASANTGAFAWEQLPIDQIERIEIVRGPRASLYGSDAIGGVIAITTRRAAGRDVLLRTGRHGRAAVQAGFGSGDADAGISLSAAHESFHGISAQTPDGFGYDPDRDGFDRTSVGVRGHAGLGEQQLVAHAFATRGSVEFDQGETDVRSHSLGLRASGPLATGWDHHLSLSQARDTLTTPDFDSQLDTRRATIDWRHGWMPAPDQRVQFGIHTMRERGSSRNPVAGLTVFDEHRDLHAVYLGWTGESGPWLHELAYRYDRSSVYGGEGSAQAAVGRRIGSGRAYLSWGQGFRAPNFNELYSPGFGGLFAGNPDLSPERSHSVEIGMDGEAGGVEFGARAYRTRVRDLIAFQGGDDFRAINLARAELEGVEIEASRRFAAWLLRGDAGWSRARDADSGSRLLRRADRQFALEVERSLGERATLALDARHVGDRADFGGDLKAFTLFSARAEWRLGDRLRLGLRIDNLFDRDYVLVRGFSTPGREWLLSLRWNDAAR